MLVSRQDPTRKGVGTYLEVQDAAAKQVQFCELLRGMPVLALQLHHPLPHLCQLTQVRHL